MEDNKQIVKDFFDAFLYNDKSRLKLADDMVHDSPIGRYEGADDFLKNCWHLADVTNEYVNLELISEGNIVCAKYDFPTAGDSPGASIMEWHTLKDGKIKEIKVIFNPSLFKAG